MIEGMSGLCTVTMRWWSVIEMLVHLGWVVLGTAGNLLSRQVLLVEDQHAILVAPGTAEAEHGTRAGQRRCDITLSVLY